MEILLMEVRYSDYVVFVSLSGGIGGSEIQRLCDVVSRTGGISGDEIQKFENDLSHYSKKYVKGINLKIVNYLIRREQKKRDTNIPISVYPDLQNQTRTRYTPIRACISNPCIQHKEIHANPGMYLQSGHTA